VYVSAFRIVLLAATLVGISAAIDRLTRARVEQRATLMEFGD